jgi:hypothetical protein
MRRLPLAAAVALLALAACRRDDGPDAAYRAFAAAARAGDGAAVWLLLSEGSRAGFEARAKALAAQVPGAPVTGRDLVLGDLSAGAPRIEKVVVVRATADEAVVGVTVRGAPDAPPAEVRLVREGGGWRVVVPG